MELVIAMAMITIIFAVVLPQFAIVRNSWDLKQGTSEAIQNGRVLTDHISRNLSKAKRITAVSASSVTNGYIQFVDNNDVNNRYDIAANSYVEYGRIGNLADLAGPVSSLKFTCYDACDFNTPITDGNSIRTVKVDFTITNSASVGQNKTFTTWVYLRTNALSRGCWSDQDIGAVAATGGATSADCNWTIVGSGVDIWDYADEFHYVYQSLSGDGQIVARVGSVTNTNSWAKAGVMIRETLDTASRHAMMVVTPGNGTSFQRRTSTGGVSTLTAGSAVTAPYWVKLTRRSNTLTGYDSNDGSHWNRVGSDTVTMATSVYIGLAVTSHSDGALCTANFNNVSFLTYEDFNETKTGSYVSSLAISTSSSTVVGDLLIAAVATDGSTAISPPSGWAAINQSSDSSGQVTLGAWWRNASAAGVTNHTFTWSGGNKQAYGWIMRFKGHNPDPANPINAWSPYSDSSQYPASPAVTNITVDGCLILRLGAFDGGDIVLDSPGLSGHSPITMDASGSSVGTVAILGSWTTGTTHAKETAGTNRALVFVAHAKSSSSSSSLTGVTYGGRTMTKIIDKLTGSSSSRAYVAAFILNDAGINAATSTTFTPTWTSQPSSITYSSVFLQNANQTALVGATASAGATSSTTVSTSALTNSVGDRVIEAAASSSTGTYSVTTGWTKDLDLSVTGYDGMGGDKPATGASETPSITQASGNHSLIGFVVQGIGVVSGGAGYVRQSTAGSSGPSTFSLTASHKAQMLTIAIAPNSCACCASQIRP